MKHALADALNENDLLRDRVSELEAILAESQEDNFRKDSAIRELYGLIKKKEVDINVLSTKI